MDNETYENLSKNVPLCQKMFMYLNEYKNKRTGYETLRGPDLFDAITEGINQAQLDGYQTVDLVMAIFRLICETLDASPPIEDEDQKDLDWKEYLASKGVKFG